MAAAVAAVVAVVAAIRLSYSCALAAVSRKLCGMNRPRIVAISASVVALGSLVFVGLTQLQTQAPADSALSTALPEVIALEVPTPAPTVNPWEKLAVRRVEVKDPIAAKIVEAARAQEGDFYDQSYRSIDYPGGDVPAGKGACTDVIIRAFRGADIDLQLLVHQDMKRDFKRYGDHWGLGRTDTNIDHRRVPNLMTFFDKHAQRLTLSTAQADLAQWQPGDVVTWKLPNNVNHIGIVSNGIGARGLPLVIHNAQRCIEQDYLDEWTVTGHYRYPK